MCLITNFTAQFWESLNWFQSWDDHLVEFTYPYIWLLMGIQQWFGEPIFAINAKLESKFVCGPVYLISVGFNWVLSIVACVMHVSYFYI